MSMPSGKQPVPGPLARAFSAQVLRAMERERVTATALAEADDRLKTKIMKVLDRMGYKPKSKEGAQAEPAKLLS